MLILDENESFSMQANVTNPGYQNVALTGMLTRQRGGKTEYTTLLPAYFYGWNGQQLSTWRQYIGTTGSQTILSRSGGQPVPSGQRIWQPLNYNDYLPPRGTGLATGQAGNRQYGYPRSDQERFIRHYNQTSLQTNSLLPLLILGGIGILLYVMVKK